MAVSISLSITQNNRNIANNTSNVTVKVTAKWTYGSYNATGQCTGSITIDGTKYSFSGIKFNTGQSTSGSQVIMTKTVDVKHASDGTKTLSCSASVVTGVSSGTVSCSGSKALTTIPRKSTLSVANGTLGTAQTLTVTRQSSGFTHSIKVVCGNSTLYIKADGSTSTSEVKHSDTSIPFTPPLSLAAQNTTGTSVSVEYTITTYNGNTNLGSNTYTKTCTIPASVKPSVSIAVFDGKKYAETYGGYIQGMSTLAISLGASGSQGSTIKSYKTTVDGKTYTSSIFTTSVISGSGTLTISTTVTDSRGRTATASKTVTVLAYAKPKINSLKVYRSDSSGNASSSGAYLTTTFDYSITSLNSKNTATIKLQYKKSSEAEYANGTISGNKCIFEADTTSTYDVVLSVADHFFDGVTKTATGSSISKLFSWFSNVVNGVKKYGFAFGKIAELEGVLDIAFSTRLLGGILHPVLAPNTDLNDVRTPNTYVGANVSSNNYGNCPITSGTFTLEVFGAGVDGQVKQRLSVCNKTGSRIFERFYFENSWGEWVCVSDYAGTLLWSGGHYMTAGHTANFNENVSKQRNGIVLVFSEFFDGANQNQSFTSVFIPKKVITTHNGSGHSFFMTTSNLAFVSTKYLYIHTDHITGHDNNNKTLTNSGITCNNNRFVLRYVIGV